MDCPNGCTATDDRPVEQEYGYNEAVGETGYTCPACGYFEQR